MKEKYRGLRESPGGEDELPSGSFLVSVNLNPGTVTYKLGVLDKVGGQVGP